MRQRSGLFVAVFGVVLLLAALTVGLPGYLAASATAGARAGVSALTGADGGFQVTIPLAADAAAQDARVRAAVRSVVRVDGRSVPMTVSRDEVTADSVELDTPGAAPVRSAVASLPDLARHAVLVAGAWPTSPAEVSMQADAAEAFAVHLGQRLTMPGGAVVTVVATWRVRDAADPRWLDDPIALGGRGSDGTAGWVVVDPSLWPQAQIRPVVRWTVLPVADRITADQLAALRASPDTVSNALLVGHRGDDVQQNGLLQLGMLPIERNVTAAGAASTAPLVVVGVLGLIMLVELSGMLEQLRAGEIALLRARGTSRRRLVIGTGVEAAISAIPGAVLGAVLAVLLLGMRGVAADIPAIGWIAAATVPLSAIVLVAAGAGRSSRDVTRASSLRGTAELFGLRGARLRSTIGIGAVVLLVLAAAVSVSQFLLYGSPLAPVAGGGAAVDPLAVSAPALAIAAIGVLAVAVFPTVARAAERRAWRARDLSSLPLQQLARRPRASLTPILMLAFAVSGLIVAASYSGTWSVSAAQTRAAQVGASVRAVSSPPLGVTITRPVTAQTAAAPVLVDDVQLGDSLVSAVAMPAARIAEVVTPVPGAVDPAALADRLAPTIDRPRVPVGATGIVLHLSAEPVSALPTFAEVSVVDAAGAEDVLLLAASGDDFRSALPPGLAPWTVHSVDVVIPEVHTGATVAVTLRATGGSTAAIPLGASWRPSRNAEQNPGIAALGGGRIGLRVTADGPGGHVLLQSVPASGTALPVVISQALAAASGLSKGSTASMSLVTRGGDVPVRVAAVSPVVPGTEAGIGVMADLGALQDAADREGLRHISADEWWVSTADAGRAAAALARRAPIGTTVETSAPTAADQVLASARDVVWVAGLATAMLALFAVGAELSAELRARRQETDILRALGVRPSGQVRVRVTEWAGMFALGLVAGVIDGVVVSALLVPGLARTAVPGAIDVLPTQLRIDPVGGPVAVGVLLLILGGMLVLVARGIRKQVRGR
jgi:hypothetical protein